MKSKAIRTVGICLLITGISILVLAGLLIIKLQRDERHADEASKRVLDVLRTAAEKTKQAPANNGESVLFDGDGGSGGDINGDIGETSASVSPGDGSGTAAEETMDQHEAVPQGSDDGTAVQDEKYMIDGTGYLGYLSFPGFDRELPVIADWDFEKLKDAPMRYKGTFEGNDIVIAGHAYDVHFGFFENEEPGNMIIFTDMHGNERQYRIAEKEVLQPTEIEKMITGDWDLTLFTCTYSGKARLALRCVAA